MKLKTKLILGIVIIIFLHSILAIADEAQQFDPNSFDYQNGDYNTIVWSQISDWSKINWDKVNWDTFDWNMLDEAAYKSIDFSKVPEKYAEKVDAKKAIDAGRGKDLPSNIIGANFEEIDDLSAQVDSSAAETAIKDKYHLRDVYSLGPSAKIRNGILITQDDPVSKNKIDSLELGLKGGWKIRVDDDGVIYATPAYLDFSKGEVVNTEITDGQISTEDHFTVDEKVSFLSSADQKITVEGASFNGKQMYVREGDTAQFDSILDTNGFEVEAKKDINIYLGQIDNPQGNYIQLVKGQQVFDSDEIKAQMERLGFRSGEEVTTRMVINSVDEEITVIPQPGNRLFNMVKRAYSPELFVYGPESGVSSTLVADDRDTLKITVSPGAQADVESRTNKGEIPSLTQSGSGVVEIRTGRDMLVRVGEGILGINPPDAFSPDLFSKEKKQYEGLMIDTRNSVPILVKIASTPDEVVIGS
ncbi:MAG: hypothetical protein AABX05_02045, partial [Nanoarchaeota archaeon]